MRALVYILLLTLPIKTLVFSGTMPTATSIENSIIKITVSFLSEQFKNNDENTVIKKQDTWTFEKIIDLAEPLGTETQLFFKLNNKEIISRMYNPQPVNIGENIIFQIAINKVHFFNYETEKTI